MITVYVVTPEPLANRIAALRERAQVEDYRYPGGGNGYREQIAILEKGGQ